MGGRKTRQSRGEESDESDILPEPKVFPQFPSAPATVQDKIRWKGFCEIESEPVRFYSFHICAQSDMLRRVKAFFNVMLKEFGVEGVKVQEVVSLDDEILMFLPLILHYQLPIDPTS